jgi:hypothetical protein
MQENDTLPCAEKIAFDTRKAALATAATSEYWYGSRPHAYHCRYCKLWHLSTSPGD